MNKVRHRPVAASGSLFRSHLRKFRPVLLPLLLIIQSSPPAAQTASDNYVRSTVMLDSTGTYRRLSVDYYDATGRPVQHVGESPIGGSTVHAGILYDACGRVSEETRPAAVEQAGYGRVTDTALGSILSSQYGDPSARMLFSYDALGRETSRRGPGAAWDQHPSTTAYGSNTADEVSRLIVSGGMIYSSGCHNAGSLARETHTDEDGCMVITYTDLAGNVVMEQRGTEGSLTATRYVYDGRDRLRYVLPCAALDGMTGTGPWDASTPSIDQYAYVYEYDGHGRVTGRKLPGCAESHTWYDRHGRVAFEDDGNLAAAGRRRFFLYDDYNRLVVSGTCKASTAPDVTWREAKAWLFSGSNTYSGYRTDVVLDSVELHVIHYYDNYTYISFGLGNEGQWLSFTPMGDAASAAPARGLLTGSRTYRLGSSECEASAFYYDAKGRMVQRRSRSPHLGQEVEYTTYSFTGKPLSRRHILTPPAGQEIDETYTYAYNDRTEDLLTVTHSVNRSTPVMIVRYTYDGTGRVASKVTGGLETTSYAYNVRSWPTKVQGQRFLEALAYEGTSWGITPSKPQWSGRISAMLWTGSSVTDYRGYRFTYDNTGRLTAANFRTGSSLGTNAQTFNETFTYDAMGNVTSLKRRGPKDSGAGLIDDLVMTYDGNRLVKCDDAVGAQPTYNGAHHFQDLADEDVEYEYDQNGNMVKDLNRNITSIEYNSLNLPKQITFSDLTKMKFTYDAAGNKLKAEYWTVPSMVGPIGPASLGGGAEPMGGGIVGPILPPINQNDPQVVTDYCGDAVYRNDTLTMLLTEEGYVTFATDGSPTYHYYLRDHLGSVRIVMRQDGTVEQRNQYYPDGTLFGKQSTGGTVQPYKFGGKELERTLPLDEYDFGARWMDPVVGGRFTTMDPLCEKYYSVSPYAYCGGDPVNYIDYFGLFASTDVKKNSDGTYTVVNAKNDDDCNIYVVDENMSRTGEIIGVTMQPFDFMDANNKTGEFTFSSKSKKIIDLNNLTVSGTIRLMDGMETTIYNGDATRIIQWGMNAFSDVQKYQSSGTVLEGLYLLAHLSKNNAPLDIKKSLGLDAYTAIKAGFNPNGSPIITTLRAVGNILFGANLRNIKPFGISDTRFYKIIIPFVGLYNQISNGGNGYNMSYPYHGEHEYSGSYIKYGYFGHF